MSVSGISRSEKGAGIADYLIILILLALVGLTASRLFGFTLLRNDEPPVQDTTAAGTEAGRDQQDAEIHEDAVTDASEPKQLTE